MLFLIFYFLKLQDHRANILDLLHFYLGKQWESEGCGSHVYHRTVSNSEELWNNSLTMPFLL